MTAEQHRSLVDRFDQADGGMPREAEWALLELAVDAIRLVAIAEQVREARLEFELTSVPVFTVKPGAYPFCTSS